jgi:hypothetical protein
LTAEGQVIMPYEAANMPLLRSFPGYSNVKKPDGSWFTTVSTSPHDRIRVLEIADKLALEVAPELRTVAKTQQEEVALNKNLYPFQVQGVRFLASGTHRLLGDDMGCIDGEAIINVNRGAGIGGKGFKIKLKDLYHKFNGGRITGGKYWDPNIPTRVRALCGEEFRLQEIERVLDKGVKPVLKVILESGKSIRLTSDHEICSLGEDRLTKEWVRADRLAIGDIVLTNGQAVCKGCGEFKQVISYEFAKFPGYCKQCMYETKRKVGNFKGGKYTDKDGYVMVRSGKARKHPKFSQWGIGEHILVMEESLGRYLTDDEEVHHKNRIKDDNRLENLEVLSKSKHMILHGKAGGYKNIQGGIGGKGGQICFVPKIDYVKSIELDGTAHVYDIVCKDPYRNFVANGIVVHNCGKTVQALCALPQNGRALVICPAVVMYNWRNEIAKWTPEFTATVVKGKDSFRGPNQREIVITNYESIPDYFLPQDKILLGGGKISEYENLPEAKGGKNLFLENGNIYLIGDDYFCWKCNRSGCYACKNKGTNSKTRGVAKVPEPLRLVLAQTHFIGDEIHRCSNRTSQRSRKVRVLSGLCKAVTGLTGTPVLNHAEQLYNMLDSINMAEMTFGHWGKFMRLFNAEKGRFGIIWGDPSPEVPELLRRVMLRRKREEVLPDLPRKTYTTITVNNIPDSLKKKLDDLEAEWGDYVDTTGELPPFEQFSAIRAELAASRLADVLEYVEDCEEQNTPLVVASAHRHCIDEVGGREGWAAITGSTPPEMRTQIQEQFQSGKLKGVALTIQAGGIGINLTRAWKMLMVDLDWTPSCNMQCHDRICRIGQTSDKIEIVTMMSSHVMDQHVNNLILKKMRMIEGSVEKLVKPIIPVNTADNILQGETSEQFAQRMELVKKAREDAEKVEKENSTKEVRTKVEQIAEKFKSKIGKWIEQPLTPELTESIRNAFNAMVANDPDYASELNGIGFNKPDSYISRWLGHNLNTESECRAMLGLLQKYSGQLKNRFPNLFPTK